MGLDMTLFGEEKQSFYAPIRPGDEPPPYEDGFQVTGKSTEVELAYWRKHWELHEYILGHFNDIKNCNDTNGRTFHLAYNDDVEEIESFIEVLSRLKIRNPYYDPDWEEGGGEYLQDDYIKQFQAAIDWSCRCPDKRALNREVQYYSSW